MQETFCAQFGREGVGVGWDRRVGGVNGWGGGKGAMYWASGAFLFARGVEKLELYVDVGLVYSGAYAWRERSSQGVIDLVRGAGNVLSYAFCFCPGACVVG